MPYIDGSVNGIAEGHSGPNYSRLRASQQMKVVRGAWVMT